jgi:hypothetical protein
MPATQLDLRVGELRAATQPRDGPLVRSSVAAAGTAIQTGLIIDDGSDETDAVEAFEQLSSLYQSVKDLLRPAAAANSNAAADLDERFRNKEFICGITGTAAAGCTTVLNSLIGSELIVPGRFDGGVRRRVRVIHEEPPNETEHPSAPGQLAVFANRCEWIWRLCCNGGPVATAALLQQRPCCNGGPVATAALLQPVALLQRRSCCNGRPVATGVLLRLFCCNRRSSATCPRACAVLRVGARRRREGREESGRALRRRRGRMGSPLGDLRACRAAPGSSQRCNRRRAAITRYNSLQFATIRYNSL